MEKNSIVNISEAALGGSGHTSFLSFLKKAWNANYKYVAFFARRCYALNNEYMHYFTEETTSRIISNNALLLYVDEFVNHYLERGYFPGVLLCDDLLLHGRGVARLLYSLEKLIIDKIEQNTCSKLSENEKNYVHQELMDAIDINIYSMGVNPILMEGSFSWNIESVKQQYEDEIRDLSQRLSLCLQQFNVPNTSYRFSIQLPIDFILKNDCWHSVKWFYRGEEREVYYKSIDNDSVNFLSIVYTHGGNLHNTENTVWVTGLSVGGDMSGESFEEICVAIVKKLKEVNNTGEFTFLIDILQEKQVLLQRQRAQLVSFILSIINIYDFCDACNISFQQIKELIGESAYNIIENNTHKIATNFGVEGDTLQGITRLTVDAELVIDLKKLIIPLFSKYAVSLLDNIEQQENNEGQTDYVAINDAAEGVFYSVGMCAEKEAYDISTNVCHFKPLEKGEDLISLSDYLSRMISVLAPHQKINIYDLLACQISLVDSGLAAMNYAYDPHKNKVQCMLKAGELSTFTMPRKLHWFIPALALIEKNSMNHNDVPREKISAFIDQLAICESNDITQNEKEAFLFLKENGVAFIDALYRCGQTIGGWNINLLTVNDWRGNNDGDETSYLRYVIYHAKRQEYYLHEAKLFLDME